LSSGQKVLIGDVIVTRSTVASSPPKRVVGVARARESDDYVGPWTSRVRSARLMRRGQNRLLEPAGSRCESALRPDGWWRHHATGVGHHLPAIALVVVAYTLSPW